VRCHTSKPQTCSREIAIFDAPNRAVTWRLTDEQKTPLALRMRVSATSWMPMPILHEGTVAPDLVVWAGAQERRECGMPLAVAAQVLPLLLSAAVAVALGADSDRADRAGAATPTERCGAQRTTPGIGVRVSRTLPARLPGWDAAGSGDPGGCSRRQADIDDSDRRLHLVGRRCQVPPDQPEHERVGYL